MSVDPIFGDSKLLEEEPITITGEVGKAIFFFLLGIIAGALLF